MTRPDDRDPALEELLRSSLAAEADTVTPRGDGLIRIRDRVSARRARRVWLRPLVAAGATVAVAGAAVGAYALTGRHSNGDDSLVTAHQPSPTTSATAPTPTPTATVTAPATLPSYPAAAFYPFTSASGEHAWEAGGGAAKQPSYTDAAAVAKSFVSDYVGASDVSLVLARHIGRSVANVTLGRTMADGASKRSWPVTVVRLVRYGAAWVVVGADDANALLKVTSPKSGAAVSAPVTVTGPAYGVDEAVQVDVRTTAGSVATKVGTASFGGGSGSWTSLVGFAPAGTGRGAVVVTEASAADGGVARITAVGVSFATVTTVAYPPYFYGVKDGKVTKYSARNGAALTFVTRTGKASDPQRVQGNVYFVSTDGSCTSSLDVVSIAGGGVGTVATANAGYAITGYGVSPDGTRIALWESACTPQQGQPQGLLVAKVLGTQMSHTVAFPSFPPMVVGDPVWDPDGQHVVAVVRTGNMATVDRIDAFAARDENDVQPACGRTAWSDYGLPTAVAVDGNGAFWVAAESSGGAAVIRCSGTGAQRMFTAAAGGGPVDVAVSSDGRAVLVTDGAGAVWRWAGGSVVKLTPQPAQPQVSW